MMNKNTDLVAIILVNWNISQETIECLRSLKKMRKQRFKVYLVDNGSKDNSVALLEEEIKRGDYHFPIGLIVSNKNLGFAGGNNLAIKKAYREGCQYYWLLNCDTIVAPDALSELLKVLESDRRIGIVGSKIYYYGTNKLWFAGGVINTWTGETRHIGIGVKDDGKKYNQIREVDYITGCSLLFRKEILEQVGYMNEGFFLCYEDAEWCLRVKRG